MFGQYDIMDIVLQPNLWSADIFIEPLIEMPFVDVYSPFYDPSTGMIEPGIAAWEAQSIIDWTTLTDVTIEITTPTVSLPTVVPPGPSLLSTITNLLKIVAQPAISILQASSGQAASTQASQTTQSTTSGQGTQTVAYPGTAYLAESGTEQQTLGLEQQLASLISGDVFGIPTWVILAGLGIGLVFGGRGKIGTGKRRRSNGTKRT